MTAWTRAGSAQLCGACGGEIRVGEPVFQIVLSPTIKKRRCRNCAGSPVPPDLPPLLDRPIQPRTKRMAPLRSVAASATVALMADWKQRQIGEPE